MAFPIVPLVAGGLALVRGIQSQRDRSRSKKYVQGLEQLAPAFRGSRTFLESQARPAISTGIQRLTDFDPMAGFDEELAARIRQPLQSVRESFNARGAFRSGRAEEEEQAVVSRSAAELLSERNRQRLAGAGALTQAGMSLQDRFLQSLAGEAGLQSGLADYFTRSSNQGLSDIGSIFTGLLEGGYLRNPIAGK